MKKILLPLFMAVVFTVAVSAQDAKKDCPQAAKKECCAKGKKEGCTKDKKEGCCKKDAKKEGASKKSCEEKK